MRTIREKSSPMMQDDEVIRRPFNLSERKTLESPRKSDIPDTLWLTSDFSHVRAWRSCSFLCSFYSCFAASPPRTDIAWPQEFLPTVFTLPRRVSPIDVRGRKT